MVMPSFGLTMICVPMPTMMAPNLAGINAARSNSSLMAEALFREHADHLQPLALDIQKLPYSIGITGQFHRHVMPNDGHSTPLAPPWARNRVGQRSRQ